jgi:hypothetical protein
MKLLNGFPIFLLLIGQAVGGNFSDSNTEVDHVNVWFTKSVGYQPRHIHIAYGSKLLLMSFVCSKSVVRSFNY